MSCRGWDSCTSSDDSLSIVLLSHHLFHPPCLLPHSHLYLPFYGFQVTAPLCPPHLSRWEMSWGRWRWRRLRVQMGSAPGSSSPVQTSCAGLWNIYSTWAWSWEKCHCCGKPPRGTFAIVTVIVICFWFCNIMSLLWQTNFPVCRTLKDFWFWFWFCTKDPSPKRL